jgi:hypothetical protein
MRRVVFALFLAVVSIGTTGCANSQSSDPSMGGSETKQSDSAPPVGSETK